MVSIWLKPYRKILQSLEIDLVPQLNVFQHWLGKNIIYSSAKQACVLSLRVDMHLYIKSHVYGGYLNTCII